MSAAIKVSLAAVLLVTACAGPAPTVDRLTISNPTDYDLEVEVSDGGREGWLPAGIVRAGDEKTRRDVVDQGQVWVFRFRQWGETVGELELSRGELVEIGWRIEAPDEVAERLQELGRPPSS